VSWSKPASNEASFKSFSSKKKLFKSFAAALLLFQMSPHHHLFNMT